MQDLGTPGAQAPKAGWAPQAPLGQTTKSTEKETHKAVDARTALHLQAVHAKQKGCAENPHYKRGGWAPSVRKSCFSRSKKN
jgi:hypothetical protein